MSNSSSISPVVEAMEPTQIDMLREGADALRMCAMHDSVWIGDMADAKRRLLALARTAEDVLARANRAALPASPDAREAVPDRLSELDALLREYQNDCESVAFLGDDEDDKLGRLQKARAITRNAIRQKFVELLRAPAVSRDCDQDEREAAK
jgi:hypothetical protein